MSQTDLDPLTQIRAAIALARFSRAAQVLMSTFNPEPAKTLGGNTVTMRN